MAESSIPRLTFRRVNLLRAHGSPSRYMYVQQRCRCTACRGATADYSAAYYSAHREERIAYQVSYEAAHRKERTAYLAAYRDRTREKAAATNAAYRVAHSEELAAYQVAYRIAHREETAAYLAEHIEERRVYVRNRHARLRSNGGTHTADDVNAQFKRQRGRCFWCGKKIEKQYDVDHVIPLKIGGSNGPENLVISCPTCNRKKKDKHPMDFAGVLF
jgi:5-methylcytosine-specific restriction endonuclease McrA